MSYLDSAKQWAAVMIILDERIEPVHWCTLSPASWNPTKRDGKGIYVNSCLLLGPRPYYILSPPTHPWNSLSLSNLIPFPCQPIETIQGSNALRPPNACLGSLNFCPHLILTTKYAIISEFNNNVHFPVKETIH